MTALAALLRILGTLDPEAAASVGAGLARRDSTFGPALAFYLALAPGGIRDWMGPAAQVLDGLDGGGTADAAARDHGVREVRAGGAAWAVLRIPLLDEHGDLGCAVWATRLPAEAGADDGAGFGFVLQVRLEVLGPVQLEGHVRRRHLDLVLRTGGGLPGPAAATVHQGFAAALADHGLTGGLRMAPLAGAWLDLDDRLHADAVL